MKHLLKLLYLLQVQFHVTYDLFFRATVLSLGLYMQILDDLNTLSRLLTCSLDRISLETVQHIISHPIINNALWASWASTSLGTVQVPIVMKA